MRQVKRLFADTTGKTACIETFYGPRLDGVTEQSYLCIHSSQGVVLLRKVYFTYRGARRALSSWEQAGVR